MSLSRDDQVARGNAAKRILEDPLVLEAFEVLERFYINQLRTAHAAPVDLELLTAWRLVAELKGFFSNVVRNGNVAAYALQEEARLKAEREAQNAAARNINR
jgi:hypothetical protein